MPIDIKKPWNPFVGLKYKGDEIEIIPWIKKSLSAYKCSVVLFVQTFVDYSLRLLFGEPDFFKDIISFLGWRRCLVLFRLNQYFLDVSLFGEMLWQDVLIALVHDFLSDLFDFGLLNLDLVAGGDLHFHPLPTLIPRTEILLLYFRVSNVCMVSLTIVGKLFLWKGIAIIFFECFQRVLLCFGMLCDLRIKSFRILVLNLFFNVFQQFSRFFNSLILLFGARSSNRILRSFICFLLNLLRF